MAFLKNEYYSILKRKDIIIIEKDNDVYSLIEKIHIWNELIAK
jgi:hypothetical protein